MEWGAWKARAGDVKPGEVRLIPGLPEEMGLTFSDLKRRPGGPPRGGPPGSGPHRPPGGGGGVHLSQVTGHRGSQKWRDQLR
jgi:hypothetical protein